MSTRLRGKLPSPTLVESSAGVTLAKKALHWLL